MGRARDKGGEGWLGEWIMGVVDEGCRDTWISWKHERNGKKSGWVNSIITQLTLERESLLKT